MFPRDPTAHLSVVGPRPNLQLGANHRVVARRRSDNLFWLVTQTREQATVTNDHVLLPQVLRTRAAVVLFLTPAPVPLVLFCVTDPHSVPAAEAEGGRDAGGPSQEGDHRVRPADPEAGDLLQGRGGQEHQQAAWPGEYGNAPL